MNKHKFPLGGVALALLTMFLSACSSLGLDSDTSYNDPERDKLYKNGSILSDKGGSDILSLGSSDKNGENTGIGVNGFLWRSSLDTISFMPIASADPFGGVIISDWYSSPGNTGERMKVNIFIRDRDLRADGVKVTVFRQVRNAAGWADAPVAPATASSLENAILTKARQIRLAQKEFK